MDRLKFIEEAELLIIELLDKRNTVGEKIDVLEKKIDKVDFNNARIIILSKQYQEYYYIKYQKPEMLKRFMELYDINKLSLYKKSDLINDLNLLHKDWEIYNDIIDQSYNLINAKVTGLYSDVRPEVKKFLEIYGAKSERGIPYKKHLEVKWKESRKV